MAGHWPEAIGLALITLAAGYIRLNDLVSRAGWDSDQGTEMLALWNALHSGTIPQLGPIASTGAFHHGALYYDLMLPGAWLGGGNPTWVLLEIALAGLTVVPIVWWVARSIAGPAAGLAAAVLASSSSGLVVFSTFIWNPTLVVPGAALAFLGAWQAWSSRKPVWLLSAAAGTAIAIQAHIIAGVLVLPMGAVLVALVLRGPLGQRRRIALWGGAAVVLVAATYIPLVVYDLSHDFAETRAIVAFFTGPGQGQLHGPAYRLAVSGLRILAWPLTGWPRWASDLPLAIGVSGALAAGLAWRLVATATPRPRKAPPPDPAGVSAASVDSRRARERDGTWLVAGCLGLTIVALGLGTSQVSAIVPDFTEQYHIVADPFVIVAAGIVLGSLWRLRDSRHRLGALGPVVCVAALVFSAHYSAGQWPTGPNVSNWPAAQSAADRIEFDAAGQSIALVGLPNDRSTDAYGYPLVRDGAALTPMDRASVLVILCNSPAPDGCGGPAEDAMLADMGLSADFGLLDRFTAAPDRIFSVYGRRPG